MSNFIFFPAKPLWRQRFFVAVVLSGVFISINACSPRGKERPSTQLPYFVSLIPDEARGRRGPSFEQPVLWEYRRRGLPLLVIDQTQFWRQVRDVDGDVVWIHKSLLSNRPMVMVVADQSIPLYRTAGDDQTVIAYADPGAVLRLISCFEERCQLKQGNVRGWAVKAMLWGAQIPAKPVP